MNDVRRFKVNIYSGIELEQIEVVPATDYDDVLNPTAAQLDALALELRMIGLKVTGRETAFFQSAVRKWLSTLNR